jgi:hypothetical protein
VINDYTLPTGTTGNQVFTLLVKDPGGLTSTASSTCAPAGASCSTPG